MIIKNIKTSVNKSNFFVTLAEAKQHLRIESDFTDDDGYISALIAVAVARINDYTNASWTDQTFKTYYDTAPEGTEWFDLDMVNLISVDALSYVDIDGAITALDLADFTISTDLARIKHKTGATDLAVEFIVESTQGIACEKVPDPIKQGVLLFLTDYYEQRQNLTHAQIYDNQAAYNLVYPYRQRLGI